MAKIPENSAVVFIFGEIDCREGILVALDKLRYGTVAEGVEHTVGIFIEVTAQTKICVLFSCCCRLASHVYCIFFFKCKLQSLRTYYYLCSIMSYSTSSLKPCLHGDNQCDWVMFMRYIPLVSRYGFRYVIFMSPSSFAPNTPIQVSRQDACSFSKV